MARKAGDSGQFEDSGDYVQSLSRGLAVLAAFDREHIRLSLAEIASRTDLSRAAARRLVLTLQHLGYVREIGREFMLGPRVLELGFGYLGSLNLTDLAQPLLEDLARRVNQSSSMAVLDGQSIVYVLRVPGRRVMSVTLGVGARLPAFCAAMGRVLLSGLDDGDFDRWLTQCKPVRHTPHTVTDLRALRRIVEDVSRQGYAYVEQELELGLCSIAVPLRNAQGRIATAINVSMPYHPDAARHAVDTILPQLQQTAAAIECCVPANRLPAAKP
ncbi:IclR family transcriptional regulator domain-containing protein [Lysobacter niastensis]|uniref:Helix-turn-helix domain-containing protein n=1 Tax=Lysobacter niastensis TaxID=380629 RepID=A0ABS0BAL7_9GAMM|nr:IclR family transcriptional regulator C-terminal domain-containing protein [Lysobacter niastensis]MBF6024074.1 helix-turn-helix domain-containing protein [Lysobacter niastensis]